MHAALRRPLPPDFPRFVAQELNDPLERRLVMALEEVCRLVKGQTWTGSNATTRR